MAIEAEEADEREQGHEHAEDQAVHEDLPSVRVHNSALSEKGVRLAKNMQVGPRIPVGIQL
jgi:hypothetical protein